MIYFILILLPIYCYADGRYECGPHGRFEYCIDGFTGCVVGCHCYPGYFFDTDTKVCEPSTKLTQEWRRHYSPIHEHGASLEAEPPARPAPRQSAAPAETSVIGEPVKGSAELSDWLYNQFFKTIENQVINKTDEEDLLKGTRRVGGPEQKPKKKRAKKERKEKKVIKHGLRRKLLRITEDDSMFESSSSSESDESDSSSSWESWDEPRGEETLPSPAGPGKEKREKDHGHRKIVVYNKRPKPPLPSFIFLPNVETPFYPMGLPLPQVPMMYPMIPIPPLQAPPDCYEDYSTTVAPTPKAELPAATADPAPSPSSVTTKTTETAATTTTATTLPPPPNAPDKETPAEAVANDAVANDAVANDAVANDAVANDAVPDDAGEVTTAMAPIGLRKSKFKGFRGQRGNNMIQALSRQRGKSPQIVKKLRPMAKSSKVTQNNHFINPEKGPLRDYNDDVYQQPFESANPARDDALPVPDEIDFKYLSQLIHRVEGNTSVPSLPTIEFNPDRNDLSSSMGSRLWKQPQGPGRLRAPRPGRRSFDAPAAPDDAYYTNLGRQIASLIRGLQPDPAGPQPDHPEMGHQPYFAENGIAPRSYWERFVRSPIRLDLLKYRKKDKVLGPGSRAQLYDLEDQAEVAAESSIVLSLSEIENAIKAMSEVQKEIGHVEKSNKKPSNKSFNVSLMPRAGGKFTYTPDIPKKPMVDMIADKKKKIDSVLNFNTGEKKGNNNNKQPQHKQNNNIVPSFTRKIQAQYFQPNHGNARALNISQTNHTLHNMLRKKIAAHDFNKFVRKRINLTISSRKPYMQVTRLPISKYRPISGLILPNKIDEYFITRKTQSDKQHTILKGPTLKGKIHRPKYFFNDFPYFD